MTRPNLASLAAPSTAASSHTSSARSLVRTIAVSVPTMGFDVEPGYGNVYGSVIPPWRSSSGSGLSPSTAVYSNGGGGQGGSSLTGTPGQGPGSSAAGSAPASSAPAASPHSHPAHSRHTSSRQLLKSQSVVSPIPSTTTQRNLSNGGGRGLALGVGVGEGEGGLAGGMSVRSANGPSGSASPAPSPGPTGFYEPPTWAQLQTLDAATAGPGGTPFLVGAQSSGTEADRGSAVGERMLLVEPANLYGQASTTSFNSGASGRANRRNIAGGGTASAALRVAVPPPMVAWASGGGNGALPPLAEALSPAGVPSGTAATSTAASTSWNPAMVPAAMVTPPPGRQRSRAAWGAAPVNAPSPGGSGAASNGGPVALMAVTGGGGTADASSTVNVGVGLGSPLPAMSAAPLVVSVVSAGGPSRRYSAAIVGK